MARVSSRPSYLNKVLYPEGKGKKVLMAQKLTDDKKVNSTGLDRDDLTPRLPPSAPPGPEAALLPNPGPGEVPAAATALPPAPPEFIEPLFWQAPIPAMETSDQCPQNSTSAGPSRLFPPLPVSTDGKGEENTAMRQRLCSTKEQGERTPL